MGTESVREATLADPNDIAKLSEWALDFRQIEPGPITTNLKVLQGENVTLMLSRIDRAVHQMGRSPEDTVTLGIPEDRMIRSWNGMEVEDPAILLFGNSAEFEGVSEAGFSGLTITISNAFLDRLADQIGLQIQYKLNNEKVHFSRRDPAARTAIEEYGRMLLHMTEARFERSENEELVAGLLNAVCDDEKFDDRSDLPQRSRAVRAALDYMDGAAGEDISIGGLCSTIGVSWRTLDRGFKERFGIGPKAYLTRLRLGRARSELHRIELEAGVAEVANAWGFWHMGQFARDYRFMFGELPSETLRRN
jgi:AraC-like DNA-binding protein